MLTANATAQSGDSARANELRNDAFARLAQWHIDHDKDYKQAVAELTGGAG